MQEKGLWLTYTKMEDLKLSLPTTTNSSKQRSREHSPFQNAEIISSARRNRQTTSQSRLSTVQEFNKK